MFSALHQGSSLYILEDKKRVKTGQVIGVTLPTNTFLGTVNITVKVGDETMEFKNVPSSQSVSTYNNVIIAETKELLSNEVESILQNSKAVLDSIEYHQEIIDSCENVLKELNPRFAQERARDEDINNLKTKIGGIETKMDEILTILSSKK